MLGAGPGYQGPSKKVVAVLAAWLLSGVCYLQFQPWANDLPSPLSGSHWGLAWPIAICRALWTPAQPGPVAGTGLYVGKMLAAAASPNLGAPAACPALPGGFW